MVQSGAGRIQRAKHGRVRADFIGQLGALTHHPELRPFDEDADGTMLGEGVGMMVLKRREDAEKDGHRIYAMVKGVGSSSDGKGKGLTAPQVEGEERPTEFAPPVTAWDLAVEPATQTDLRADWERLADALAAIGALAPGKTVQRPQPDED